MFNAVVVSLIFIVKIQFVSLKKRRIFFIKNIYGQKNTIKNKN